MVRVRYFNFKGKNILNSKAKLLLKGKSYVFHCKLWPIYNLKTICIVTDESYDSIHIQITLQLTVPILDKNQICKHNLIPGLPASRFVTKFTKLIAAKRVFVIYNRDLHHHISTKVPSKAMWANW